MTDETVDQSSKSIGDQWRDIMTPEERYLEQISTFGHQLRTHYEAGTLDTSTLQQLVDAVSFNLNDLDNMVNVAGQPIQLTIDRSLGKVLIMSLKTEKTDFQTQIDEINAQLRLGNGMNQRISQLLEHAYPQDAFDQLLYPTGHSNLGRMATLFSPWYAFSYRTFDTEENTRFLAADLTSSTKKVGTFIHPDPNAPIIGEIINPLATLNGKFTFIERQIDAISHLQEYRNGIQWAKSTAFPQTLKI